MFHDSHLRRKVRIIVGMVIGSSSGIFARPAWRDASPGGVSVIVDVNFAIVIDARPVGRGRRSRLLRYVGDVAVEVKPVVPWGS
jgi:hypothetical protein